MKTFNSVVAVDNHFGISREGMIPWDYPEDMKFFKQITDECIVIMGRKTWDSLPEKNKPLKRRYNIIISSDKRLSNDINQYIFVNSFESALKIAYEKLGGNNQKYKDIFIIGGNSIYQEAFSHALCGHVYVTMIKKNYNCDNVLNCLDERFKLILTSKGDSEDLSFNVYCRDEMSMANIYKNMYLGLIGEIYFSGAHKDGRNGGTRSVFGKRLEFDLSGGEFPLITSKFTPVRMIFEELMWIIRGQTDVRILQEKGIHIWDGNSSREFLDSRGLTDLEEWHIGRTYGYTMRQFGGIYDQLRDLIYKLKNVPDDRRLIMSLWNPIDNEMAALPPCVYLYQFYIRRDEINDIGYLSLMLNIRSSDVPVALHWNICHAGLLMKILASYCGYTCERLIINLGDAHIYEEHISEVQNILSGQFRPMPRLEITGVHDNIEDYQFEDINIIEYNWSRGSIGAGVKLKMIA